MRIILFVLVGLFGIAAVVSVIITRVMAVRIERDVPRSVAS